MRLILSFRLICCLFFGALAFSCARQSAPEGGPKDKQAPKLHPRQYSTPNKQTNFTDKELILTFDEWIQLKDAANQVLISPDINGKYKIKVRNHSVVLRFLEPLMDSTTYTVNFGNAITDITESNPAKDMNYVFSTGPFLDSLTAKGNVVDAVTGQPKEEVLIMLYDQLHDSIPKTQRPFYVTRTDAQGQFKIENIKQDSFKIFALVDKNNNMLYDLPTEEVAFWPENFEITDSTQPFFKLILFPPLTKPTVEEAKWRKHGQFDWITNQNKKDSTIVPRLSPRADQKIYTAWQGDTLRTWVTSDLAKDSLFFIVEIDGEPDTLGWKYWDTTQLKKAPIKLYFPSAAATKRGTKKGKKSIKKILEKDSISFFSTIPLTKIDASKCLLFKDSITIDSSAIWKIGPDKNQITIQHTQQPKQIYKAIFLPEALTDFYGRTNPDTLQIHYQIYSPEDLGSVTAIIKNADSTQQYIVQLLNKTGTILKAEKMQEVSTKNITYEQLAPGAYTIQVLFDKNRNGQWDTGDYTLKRQPEKRVTSKAINLRANWESEQEIDLNPPKRKG